MEESASLPVGLPSPAPRKRPFRFPFARSPHPAPASSLQAAAAGASADPWSLGRLLAFRLTFCYLVLYLLPFPLNSLPGMGALLSAYEGFWTTLIPLVGEDLLAISAPISTAPNGSGDTTFNYVQLLVTAVLAFAAAALWSVLDRRRRAYPRLYEALRIYVRFGLGSILLSYGIIKVIKTQFPTPDLDRLLETYGNSSPMGLLWTFMGASTAYTFFAGAMEVVGGMLLFFRRTTTIGALVSAVVMANVVLLNFCYDVPVKLFSVHLLLMALWLAGPALRPLADLLFFHRATTPPPLTRPFATPWKNRAATALGLLFVSHSLYVLTKGNLQTYRQYGDGARKPPLYGAYEVEDIKVDGKTIPPSLFEGQRFRRMVFNRFGRLTVIRVDDTRERFNLRLDPRKRTLRLIERGIVKPAGSLHYTKTPNGGLLLSGTLRGQAYDIRLARMPESEFLLTSRGFRWINEMPFNR